MLDTASAAILTGVSTEILAQAYFLTVRPESTDLKEKGEKFYNDHVVECQRLQRVAEADLAERVIRSPLRQLYEKSGSGPAEAEGKPLRALELKKFEQEFTAIGSKFKEFAAPGADLGTLRTEYTNYSRHFHNFYAGLIVLAAAIVYAGLWYVVTGDLGPYSSNLNVLLFLTGILAFGLLASNFPEYARLRSKIPADEQKLLDAIHTKVQFSDQEAPPAEVPSKAAPPS